MENFFRIYTAGYEHGFVKQRQRYFPLKSLNEACANGDIPAKAVHTSEEIQQFKETACRKYGAEFKYLVHEVYQCSQDEDDSVFLYLSITDTETGEEILHMDKKEQCELITREFRVPISSRRFTLVSMSKKGVKLLSDLTAATLWAVYNTQTMVKRLCVDPVEPPTLGEILKKGILESWLPNGISFDLNRLPNNEQIIYNRRPDADHPKWENRAASTTRCVRYVDSTMTWLPDLPFCTIPLTASPSNRSLLMIPLKHTNSNKVRSNNDEFLMYIEIIYKAKPAENTQIDTRTLQEVYVF